MRKELQFLRKKANEFEKTLQEFKDEESIIIYNFKVCYNYLKQ